MMQSTESSNSSSSESDSDLEDVDEEVAKLNARLIDQSVGFVCSVVMYAL